MDNNSQNNPYSNGNADNTWNSYCGANGQNNNMYTAQNGYGQQQYQQQGGYYNQSPYGTGMKPADPGQGKGIASMILGICSIVTCWLYGIVGLICGIIGFVLAKQSKEASGGVQGPFAKAGFVCSIIGMILSGLFLLYVIFVVWLCVGVLGFNF